MPPSPATIGPYDLERLLAVGATARVYRAGGARGPVVLKIARTADDRPTLRREAQLLHRCAHPHLARLDHAARDGSWLATEVLHGHDIVSWAQGRSVDEIVGAALELLEPLRHLHAQGVLHGDLKPGNVLMVDWGHPKLLDLGGARTGEADPPQRGTPGFAAPEQLQTGVSTPASDLYGFGAILHACLTGRAPFHAADPAAVLHLSATSTPLPPSAFRVDVPARLDRLVMRLLARNALRRPEMAEVIKTLCTVHHSAPARPVVGMTGVRARLRHLVASSADGAPRCVVLYGAEGSGRRTLADEAIRQAREEGMRPIKAGTAADFLRALADGGRPARALHGAAKGTAELVQRTLASGRAGLVVVVAARPLPRLGRLGAVHLAPEPLDHDAAQLIGRWLGVEPEQGTALWEQTGGHPRALWLAMAPHASPEAAARVPALPTTARKLLEALTHRHGAASATQLARETGLDPAVVLDHCEALLAAGHIGLDPSGRRFRSSEP